MPDNESRTQWMPVPGERLQLGLVLLLGALLRLFRIGYQSYWADEVLSILHASGQKGPLLQELMTNFHGPLHFLFLRGWAQIGGWGEVWLRSLSALTALVSIWLLFVLARRFVGPRAALLSALLLAISPFHIWYSQEVRNYTQLIAFSTASMIFYMKILDREGPRSWIGFLLCSAAALLSNLAALFLFAFQGIYLIIRRPRLVGKLLLALLLILLVLSPWLKNFELGWRPDLVGQKSAVRNLNFHPMALGYTFFVYSVGDTAGPSRDEMNRQMSASLLKPFLPYFALAGLLFGLLFFRGLRARFREREGLIFFLLWLILPMLIVAVLAALNIRVYNVRYVSVGLPAYLILLGTGLASFSRRWQGALLVLLLLTTGFSLKNAYGHPRYSKPDARAAAAAVTERARAGDGVVVYSIEEPFEYYYCGAGELRSLDWANPNHDLFWDGEHMAYFEKHFDRLWLVDYRGWYADPEGETPRVFRERWRECDVLDFAGVKVLLFENPARLPAGGGEHVP